MDICIVTYNRLIYLERCVWSLIAASKQVRIFIIDDASTDGTREWLIKMKLRGLIHKHILRDTNQGTAKNFNSVIRASDSDYFMMCNDDMYFHRGWQEATNDIIEDYADAGIVSFYDYTRYRLDGGIPLSDKVWRVVRTGLGASVMYRKLFDATGGFVLPHGRLMGFFATPFCKRAKNTRITRNNHYATIPNYAIHMDILSCPLNEKDTLEEYIKHRVKHKHNKVFQTSKK